MFPLQEFPFIEKSENELDSDGDMVNLDEVEEQKSKEKYSLRPRALRQRTEKGLELKAEIQSQRKRKGPDGSGGKPKPKPPPLSKYRRKTANARERNRMREINVAFETLRRVVPHISDSFSSGNEKLTKITTLRLAMKYIQALRQVLDRTNNHPNFLHHFSLATIIDKDRDLDVLMPEADNLVLDSGMRESLSFSDNSMSLPFSELSNSGEMPFSPNPDFTFHDSILSPEFSFDTGFTDSELGDVFLNTKCIDGLS